MNNQREPFWWPMTAPPLPNREDDLANGWQPWVDPEADAENLLMTEWEVAINDQ